MIWHWKSTHATFQSRPTAACCLIVYYVPEHSRGNSPFSWEVLSVMIWHRAPGTTARVLLPHAWWSRPCLRIWSPALPCRRRPSLHPGRFFPVALIFGRWVITLKKKNKGKEQKAGQAGTKISQIGETQQFTGDVIACIHAYSSENGVMLNGEGLQQEFVWILILHKSRIFLRKLWVAQGQR